VEKWLSQEVAQRTRKHNKKGRVLRLIAARKAASLELRQLVETHPSRKRLEIRINSLNKQITSIQNQSLSDENSHSDASSAQCPATRVLGSFPSDEAKRAMAWLFRQLSDTRTQLKSAQSEIKAARASALGRGTKMEGKKRVRMKRMAPLPSMKDANKSAQQVDDDTLDDEPSEVLNPTRSECQASFDPTEVRVADFGRFVGLLV
jgi:hypothetical protein